MQLFRLNILKNRFFPISADPGREKKNRSKKFDQFSSKNINRWKVNDEGPKQTSRTKLAIDATQTSFYIWQLYLPGHWMQRPQILGPANHYVRTCDQNKKSDCSTTEASSFSNTGGGHYNNSETVISWKFRLHMLKERILTTKISFSYHLSHPDPPKHSAFFLGRTNWVLHSKVTQVLSFTNKKSTLTAENVRI